MRTASSDDDVWKLHNLFLNLRDGNFEVEEQIEVELFELLRSSLSERPFVLQRLQDSFAVQVRASLEVWGDIFKLMKTTGNHSLEELVRQDIPLIDEILVGVILTSFREEVLFAKSAHYAKALEDTELSWRWLLRDKDEARQSDTTTLLHSYDTQLSLLYRKARLQTEFNPAPIYLCHAEKLQSLRTRIPREVEFSRVHAALYFISKRVFAQRANFLDPPR